MRVQPPGAVNAGSVGELVLPMATVAMSTSPDSVVAGTLTVMDGAPAWGTVAVVVDRHVMGTCGASAPPWDESIAEES
jgi:hypothetical protein